MTSQAGERRFVPPDGLRLIFFGIIGLWLLFPVLVKDNLAQDAVPYLAVGELVRDDPGVVYAAQAGDLYNLRPRFAQRSCDLSPIGTDCANLSVPFVSAPAAIPFAVLVSKLGADGGVLLMRLIAAAALSGGMWVLWNRLAHRTEHGAHLLVATALLLTPFAVVPVVLGQTSSLLFLSACLGVSRSERRPWGILSAGLWVLNIAFKLFPVALVPVLIWQRRWRFLLWSAVWFAGFAVLAGLIAPVSLWRDFVQASSELAGLSQANPYNGSVDSLVRNVFAPITDNRTTGLVLMVVRVALALGLMGWVARRADDDTQWAFGFLAALLVVPLVWWHYLWVAVAAVGVALAGRVRLDDRTLAILPALAAVTVPISIPNGRGGSVPIAQGVFLLAAAGLVAVLVHAAGRTAGSRAATAA